MNKGLQVESLKLCERAGFNFVVADISLPIASLKSSDIIWMKCVEILQECAWNPDYKTAASSAAWI